MMLIYEAYNKNNGKVYVGLTTQTLDKRKSSHLRSAKSGSNSYFHKAIRKYGVEAFDWYVVAETDSLTNLYKLEKLFISLYEDWQTYNISLGGEHSAFGMKHTELTKKICSEYGKKRWNGKRSSDIYPKEAFLCKSYKEAREKYNIPKTTWYRGRVLAKGDIP
jgi:group I intron endonuclease